MKGIGVGSTNGGRRHHCYGTKCRGGEVRSGVGTVLVFEGGTQAGAGPGQQAHRAQRAWLLRAQGRPTMRPQWGHTARAAWGPCPRNHVSTSRTDSPPLPTPSPTSSPRWPTCCTPTCTTCNCRTTYVQPAHPVHPLPGGGPNARTPCKRPPALSSPHPAGDADAPRQPRRHPVAGQGQEHDPLRPDREPLRQGVPLTVTLRSTDGCIPYASRVQFNRSRAKPCRVPWVHCTLPSGCPDTTCHARGKHPSALVGLRVYTGVRAMWVCKGPHWLAGLRRSFVHSAARRACGDCG